MRMYNQKQVEQLRKRYPEGTRLCLDFMDEAGMPPGLQGTVAFIDDAGQIHMHWENGRSLAIVPGVGSDSRKIFFEKILDVLTMMGGGLSDVR